MQDSIEVSLQARAEQLDKELIELSLTRHSSTKALVQYFTTAHLRQKQRDVVEGFQSLVIQMLEQIPSDTPELTAGLRKLLEAKDCMVRASLAGLS